MPRPSNFNSVIATTVLSKSCTGTTADGDADGNRSGASSLAGVEEDTHEHRIRAGMTLRKIIRRHRNSDEPVLMFCMRATTEWALRRKDLVGIGRAAS